MSGSLVVETRAGKVRGALDRSCLGPEFCSFKGIPFAAPPVGKLRFQDPVQVEPWSGIRDATDFGPKCTQADFLTNEIQGSDDCLYLNVYTHSCKPEKPRAVMVWIYGGGFVGGSGDDMFYGPDYFMAKDIVLVTINYRVGILGFLNLEDEVAPGNQGLKDQVAALKWVRDNIANFGGDPDNVTIFGESAGGASVHYLTTSPMAKGLFHKAIVQSGVILNTWAYHTNAKERVYRVCERLGFKSRDSKAIVEFLRTIDSRKLVEAQESILNNEEKIQFEFSFGPGVDAKSKEPFMAIPIEEAAKKGAQVPLIIGHTNLEGAVFARMAGDDYKRFNQNFEKYLHPHAIDLLKRYNLSADDAKRLYCGNEEITNDNIEKLLELIGDMYFVEGVHRVVKMQTEAGSAPTYLYRYTFDKEPSPFKVMLNLNVSGATHAAELPYFFLARQMDGISALKKGTLGYKMMERLIDLWVNFAKTGRPTPTTTEDMPFYWTPVNSGSVLRYLNIDEDLRLEVMLNLEQRYLTHKITRNKL